MKFAIIKAAGSQYQVSEGDELELDLQKAPEGGKTTFEEVLLLVDGEKIEVGQPFVNKAVVEAEVIEHFKGEKIRVATYKAKSRYRRTIGFRASKTKLKIIAIKKEK